MITHIGVIVSMIINWKMILLGNKFNNSSRKLILLKKEKGEDDWMYFLDLICVNFF